MQPRVTIILPFTRNSKLLPDAIESIICQTYELFELLLINCNADEETLALALRHASLDNRISLIEEPLGSLANALNEGILNTSSPYIAIADERDISYPDRLKKQVEYLDKNADVGLMGTRVRYIPIHEEPEKVEYLNQFFSWSNRIITDKDISINRFAESPIIHSSIMFRRELVNKYSGFISGDFPEEHELILRWLAAGVKMYKLPEVLCDWNEEPERLSLMQEKYIDQGLYEMKSRYAIEWIKEKNAFFPEVVVWGAGKTSRQRFFILHELGVHAKFFIDLRANEERNVIQYQHTPPAGRNFIISYVTNRAFREKIREFLVELGYVEGKDFVFMA